MKAAITITVKGFALKDERNDVKLDDFNFATECECTVEELTVQMVNMITAIKLGLTAGKSDTQE